VEKYKGGAFRFIAVDGLNEIPFKHGFSYTTELPSLIAYSPQKQRLSDFIGSFTVDAISKFLENVLKGRTATIKIDQVPSLSK